MGSHIKPRRNLSQSAEKFARQDLAVKKMGYSSWAEWARDMLEQDAELVLKYGDR